MRTLSVKRTKNYESEIAFLKEENAGLKLEVDDLQGQLVGCEKKS